jgi:hypothetical protein
MQYGDQRTIDQDQNAAIRHLAAALRCALGPTEASRGATTGHDHIDAAIKFVEKAEAAAEHTNDEAKRCGNRRRKDSNIMHPQRGQSYAEMAFFVFVIVMVVIVLIASDTI